MAPPLYYQQSIACKEHDRVLSTKDNTNFKDKLIYSWFRHYDSYNSFKSQIYQNLSFLGYE